MKQSEIEKLNARSSDILMNAIVNHAYFEQAQDVCDTLNPDVVEFKVEKMKSFLTELIRSNGKVLNLIKSLQKDVTTGMTDCYEFDRDFQDMAFWILKAEEGRKLLFANGSFKTYVEPAIKKYFRDLMQKNNNEEVAECIKGLNQPKTKIEEAVSASK